MSNRTHADDDDPRAYRRAVESLIGIPATDGNTITVLRNGDEIFPAMLAAIRGAEETIDMLTYVWWEGAPAQEFAAALAARAADGVRVRVLVDAVGGRDMDESLAEHVRESGGAFETFRPVDNPRFWQTAHRTHRRVLLVDGQVGFTGGVGIAEEWLGDARNENEWRETHVRIDGPAVDGLRAAFIENWAETDQPLLNDERYPALPSEGSTTAMVVRSSAGHGVSSMSILKRILIELARKRVRITTAYLAPDDGAMQAIRDARARGVQVQLLVPGKHTDKRVARIAAREHFEQLLELGVEIFTYERSMLHAKTLTIDGIIADIGSANFNSRSLAQDEEVDLVMFDPEVAATLDAHFDQDLEVAEEIDLDRWEERGWIARAKEAVVGLGTDVM